jgi:hypothetical protein
MRMLAAGMRLSGTHEADVVVVDAGITGLTTGAAAGGARCCRDGGSSSGGLDVCLNV